MRITLLSGVLCTPDRGTAVDIRAGEFLDELGTGQNGTPSLECLDEAAKKAGNGFVLAQYKPGATTKEQADLEPSSTTEILCYDIDTQTHAEVTAMWPRWAQCDAAVYSTWKHTAGEPRIRLLVRLSRPVANASGDEFPKLYHAVAHLLGVKFDASTKDRARFFFGPQHKPGMASASWRYRFEGDALPVDAILGALAAGRIPPAAVTAPVAAAAPGLLRLPEKSVLQGLATRWLRASVSETVAMGATLEAVLARRAYAKKGGIHLAGRDLAFGLVRDVPLFDGEAFATQYLAPCWASMPGSGDDVRLAQWLALVTSASAKLASKAGAASTAQANLYPTASALGMDDEDVEAARGVGGALVNEHRGNYYAWDSVGRRYVGPLKATGLHAVLREGLQGLPGFEFVSRGGQGGKPTLKSGPQLVTEYGYTLQSVNYWAHPPTRVFDVESMAIHVPAYHWNEWAATRSQAADELLRALGGSQYPRLEAWLAKFTDLRQPLPALVLVGPRGVWKSRLAQILSRFWASRHVGQPCDATQVLGRFSRPLLTCPVIHSDEAMAKSEAGRAIPEVYRTSITSTMHQVEAKGVDPVSLNTATRHIISVNHLDQVFGGEIDAASAEATAERYLVVEIDGGAMAAFEQRWEPYYEGLTALREGTPVLEHVAWLASTSTYTGTCRLWVDTGTDLELALRARFSDECLTICLTIAIEALLAEPATSNPGQIARLPLVLDEAGQLRLSPARIVGMWSDSKVAAGSAVRKPTAQRVGQMLQKAGLKSDPKARASHSRQWKAWGVNHDTLRQFLHVEGTHDWSEIEQACETIWSRVIS